MSINSFALLVAVILIVLYIIGYDCTVNKKLKGRWLKPYDQSKIKIMKANGILECPKIVKNISENFEEIIKNAKKSEVMVISECGGKQYILLKYMVKYEDIWSECAKYGTIPASVDSLDEIVCIEQSYYQQKGVKFRFNERPSYYHTSHVDMQANGVYLSCVTGKDINDPKMWVSTEPNNFFANETCVALNIGGSLNKAGFVDSECNSLPVLCEYSNYTLRYIDKAKISANSENSKGIKFSQIEYVDKKPSKSWQFRQNYDKQKIQMMKEKGYLDCPKIVENISEDFKEIVKNVNRNEVMVISECRPKQYILTKYLVNFLDIWSECAKYGGIPASVENADEAACILRSYQKQKGIKYKIGERLCYFYTSHMDNQANGDFKSCVTGNNINDRNLWTSGEPNNYYFNETCVALNLGGMSKSSFIDTDCTFHSVICEYSDDTLRYIEKAKNMDKIQMCIDGKNVRQEENVFKPTESESCKRKSFEKKNMKDMQNKLEYILNLLKTQQRKITF